MFRNKKSEILWGLNHKAYMYGSKIVKRQDGSVQFYNPLVPSGTEIQSWVAIQNYQAARTQPALPLLKKGHSYDLTANLEAVPTGSVFLKVSFLDRYDNEIKQLIEKSTHMTFVYPHEAYTYRIFLLSAGVKELDFYNLKLEETGEEHV